MATGAYTKAQCSMVNSRIGASTGAQSMVDKRIRVWTEAHSSMNSNRIRVLTGSRSSMAIRAFTRAQSSIVSSRIGASTVAQSMACSKIDALILLLTIWYPV